MKWLRNSSFCSLNLIQPIIMSPHSERPHSLYYLTINNSQEEYLKLELPNHCWMYATKAASTKPIIYKWWNTKLWWNLRHLTSHDELWEVHCTARVFIKYLKKRVGDVLVSCVVLLQGEGDKLLLGHLPRRVFVFNEKEDWFCFTLFLLTHLNKLRAAS